MKKINFLKLILSILLMSSVLGVDQSKVDIENPHDLYRDSSIIIGETFFSNEEGSEALAKNTETFIKVTNLLRRVDLYAYQLSVKMKSTLSSGRVVNGEEVYQISTLLNIYHGIAVKLNELNTYAKPNSLQSFLQEGDDIRRAKDLLWLATYTRLYLSFYNNYHNYYKHINLRKIIKNLVLTKSETDQKVDELFVMVSHTLEKENRKEVKHFLRKYNDFKDSYAFDDITVRALIDSLIYEIEEDHAVNKILAGKVVSLPNYNFTDSLFTFFGKITNAISGIFGNLVGKIRWRQGHFYKDELVKNKLMKKLKPLDILFEKTPFALTDTFIPGHFGHAALYLGTEDQLKELGVWNSKVIRPYQKAIRSGQIIVEAIRSGVGLTSMEKFMQIDEIAIIRQPNILEDSREVKEIYKRAIDQIGKDYDFNFDVETTDKIVCSELLFFAFGRINWPTEYILGRPTISPDNLAELTFFDNTPMSFVLNYWSKKRGTLVEADIEELAKNIGYQKNEERSTSDNIAFDKKEYRCKTVLKNTLKSGSRRSRRIHQRVCSVVFEKRVYNDGENLRNEHIRYQQRY